MSRKSKQVNKEYALMTLFEVLSSMCTMCVFLSQFLNIVPAYLPSIYNLAVTFTLTLMLQEDEKEQFFQEIGGCLKRK